MYLLFDAPNLFYRSWHAPPCRGFVDYVDIEENGEKAFRQVLPALSFHLSVIVKYCIGLQPDFVKVILVWDGKHAIKLRREIYPEYKKGRRGPGPFPQHLDPVTHLDRARTELGNICQRFAIRHSYAEADDMLAILKECLAPEKVVIISADSDLLQLVDEFTRVYNPITRELLDRRKVKGEYDVEPYQIAEFKALQGDPSDNYYGLPKVGPKKAAKWINEGRNSEIIGDEITTYRKLATLPFYGLNKFKILTYLATIKYDEVPRWDELIDKYEFSDFYAKRAKSVF